MSASRHHPVNSKTHQRVHTRSFSLGLRRGKIRKPERQIAALLKEMLDYLNTSDEMADHVIVDVTVFTKPR